MAIRRLLERAKDKGRLIYLLGSLWASVAAGQACVNPEGVQVQSKPGADGIVTKEERDERVEAAADMETIVYHDNPVLLGHLNDEDVAMKNRWESRDMKWETLGDLYLHTSQDVFELGEHYEYCTSGEDMPEHYGAFFCDANDTAYLIAGFFNSLNSIFYHERGHFHNIFDGSNKIAEIPSEAMRVYMTIAGRSINRDVGTMLGRRTFSDHVPPDTVINGVEDIKIRDGKINQYQAGVLTFFGVANDNDGDLDKTYREIRNANEDDLEDMFNSIVDRHPGATARQMWLNEIDDLLESPGFSNYLGTLNLQKGEKRTEAQELRDYLQIMVKTAHIVALNLEEKDSSQQQFERHALREEFYDDCIKLGCFNPYFKNIIVADLTEEYDAEIDYMKNNNPTQEDFTDIEYLAEKIIDMNAEYPCEYEPFACSSSHSRIKPEHLSAYEHQLWARYSLENIDHTLDVADAFLKKFYPDEDYTNPEHDPALRSSLVKMMRKAYTYGTTLASKAFAKGDEDKARDLRCKALKYIRIFNDAACANIEDIDKKTQCYNDTQSVNFENYAQTAEENLENTVGGFCGE